MEGIFRAHVNEAGKLLYANPKDVDKVLLANKSSDVTVTIEPTIIKSEKKRMYAYYMRVLLPLTVRALTLDGWELVDDSFADHYLKSVCAKSVLYNSKTKKEETYATEKRSMTKERLRKFVSDAVWLLEERQGVVAPDASEYKMAKETGHAFRSAKFNRPYDESIPATLPSMFGRARRRARGFV